MREEPMGFTPAELRWAPRLAAACWIFTGVVLAGLAAWIARGPV